VGICQCSSQGPQKPQTVDEFAHHLFVGVVEEQRHRQHEVDDHSGRQQAATALGAAGVREHLIDKITVHQSGQHAQADPVGQPVCMTVFTTGAPVDHRNRFYVESVAAQYFYEPI
jgi:hypothetical protein